MKKGSSYLLPLIVALSFAGCAKKNDSSKSTIDVSTINNNSNLTPEQKATELADAGEQLFSAQGFVYAETVMDMALAADPKNPKAGFYKHLLAFVSTDRGILKRIQKLAARTQATRESFEQIAWQMDKMPESNLFKFLMDPSQKDIQTESDVQAYLESKVNALENLRQWLRQNKQSSFKLTGTDSMMQGLAARMNEECTTVENEDGVYEINCKDLHERRRNTFSVNVNSADLEAIQHMTAALELLFTSYISYDLSGMLDVVLRSDYASLPTNAKLNAFLANPQFGTLRQDSKIGKLQEMGTDLIAGARWLKSIQKQVCTNPKKKYNRTGFLFNQGFCLEQNPEKPLEQTLEGLKHILNGGTIEGEFELKSGPYRTQYAPLMPLLKPIKDVRQLGLQVNACGEVIPEGDPTIAGLFPKRDGLVILKGNSKCGF